MSWYAEALKKYAVFRGRAGRKEYWVFALVNAIIVAALAYVETLGDTGPLADIDLALPYVLFIVVPTAAVQVRRLHDTGRSGWWALIVAVPVIGALALLVFALQDGTPGRNKYGPSPKATPAVA